MLETVLKIYGWGIPVAAIVGIAIYFSDKRRDNFFETALWPALFWPFLAFSIIREQDKKATLRPVARRIPPVGNVCAACDRYVSFVAASGLDEQYVCNYCNVIWKREVTPEEAACREEQGARVGPCYTPFPEDHRLVRWIASTYR